MAPAGGPRDNMPLAAAKLLSSNTISADVGLGNPNLSLPSIRLILNRRLGSPNFRRVALVRDFVFLLVS